MTFDKNVSCEDSLHYLVSESLAVVTECLTVHSPYIQCTCVHIHGDLPPVVRTARDVVKGHLVGLEPVQRLGYSLHEGHTLCL